MRFKKEAHSLFCTYPPVLGARSHVDFDQLAYVRETQRQERELAAALGNGVRPWSGPREAPAKERAQVDGEAVPGASAQRKL